MSPEPTVASFFSGCGGFDLGFEKAGYKVVIASDNWSPARDTYKLNFPETNFLFEDIKSAVVFIDRDIVEYYDEFFRAVCTLRNYGSIRVVILTDFDEKEFRTWLRERNKADFNSVQFRTSEDLALMDFDLAGKLSRISGYQ